MRVNRSIAVALMFLVLVVLNILFFIWTDAETRGSVEWMSYGFMMFSFFVVCWGVFRVREDSNEVYHLTTNFLPISYFCVQTVLSAIAIYYAMVLRKAAELTEVATEKANSAVNTVIDTAKGVLPDSIRGVDVDSIGAAIGDAVNSSTEAVTQQTSFFAEYYPIIVLSVYLLVLVFYAISLGVHKTANDATKASLAEQAAKYTYIADNTKRLQRLKLQIHDMAAKHDVDMLYSIIKSSPVVASGDGREAEIKVEEGIAKLESLVADKDWEGVKTLAKELQLTAKLR